MENLLLYEETKKLPEIFQKDEIRKIIRIISKAPFYLNNDWGEWMRARDISIFVTLYFLGLRPKEACCLRFDDFNLRDFMVKIRGENNKTKKDRILPIPKKIIPFYKVYFSFPKNRFWRGSPYLFPSFQNEYISPERWKHRFRQILKYAGLWKIPINSNIPPFRSYTLRHTRATELLDKSKDIFLVANFLGHSKLSSTKIYLHKTKNYQKYMKKIINKI
jgi:integrase